jgi:hypothetical protein
MKRTIAIVAGLLAASLPIGSIHAQSTPRSVCCSQMGGQWKANRSGEMRCYGVASDPYYKCVAQRTSGKK